MFDKNYYKNTSFWGNGYPRPCYENELQSHVKRPKKSEDANNYVRVFGKAVFDLSSWK